MSEGTFNKMTTEEFEVSYPLPKHLFAADYRFGIRNTRDTSRRLQFFVYCSNAERAVPWGDEKWERFAVAVSNVLVQGNFFN